MTGQEKINEIKEIGFLEKIAEFASKKGLRSLEEPLVAPGKYLQAEVVGKILPINIQKYTYHQFRAAWRATKDFGIPVIAGAIVGLGLRKSHEYSPEVIIATTAGIVLFVKDNINYLINVPLSPLTKLDELIFEKSPEYLAAKKLNHDERLKEFSKTPDAYEKYEIEMRKRPLDSIMTDSFEGTYGFLLKTKKWDKKVAKLAYDFEKGVPTIRQIQGQKDAGELLEPLKWDKLLISVTGDVMKEAGHKQLAIQPAARNIWVIPGHMEPEKAKIRYDVTAKRMGFNYDQNKRLWIKELV